MVCTRPFLTARYSMPTNKLFFAWNPHARQTYTYAVCIRLTEGCRDLLEIEECSKFGWLLWPRVYPCFMHTATQRKAQSRVETKHLLHATLNDNAVSVELNPIFNFCSVEVGANWINIWFLCGQASAFTVAPTTIWSVVCTHDVITYERTPNPFVCKQSFVDFVHRNEEYVGETQRMDENDSICSPFGLTDCRM